MSNQIFSSTIMYNDFGDGSNFSGFDGLFRDLRTVQTPRIRPVKLRPASLV